MGVPVGHAFSIRVTTRPGGRIKMTSGILGSRGRVTSCVRPAASNKGGAPS